MSCPRDFLNHERLWIGVKYVCVLFRHNTSYRKYIRSITSLAIDFCIVEFVIVGPLQRVRPRNDILALVLVVLVVLVVVLPLRSEFIGELPSAVWPQGPLNPYIS